MIVDVFPVCVGGNDKSVFALGKPHGKFIAHLVGFLGGNLTGFERLSNLIGDHIIFLYAPSDKFILPLGKHKFFVCGQGAALIAADQFSLVRFVRILRVVRAAFQAGRNRLALVFVQRNQTCCGHRTPPFLKNKLELTSKSDTLVKISVKGICPMKKHGHYCKVCDEYKANEKFSGKGHTAHICKKCAALPPDVRSAQMIENKLLSLPWRLSKEQIKWLNNKAHDKRPEIRKLAQEQLDMRFHPERLASDDADEFEDLLLNKDDEDEDEW